ncbi:hypothetical protein CDL15_Pgr009984 [Punica granatum]|uniref:Protein kinase domain-containing protein n=1 Tax=Punica granatum TaxID=22663 RepID=A0A218X5N2_PUNGR|nr:hypothetical protein CDL15_Pgr009984 [Punica granatum]
MKTERHRDINENSREKALAASHKLPDEAVFVRSDLPEGMSIETQSQLMEKWPWSMPWVSINRPSRLSLSEGSADNDPVAVPASSPIRRRHGHHRHARPRLAAPSPSKEPGCAQVCTEPLTATPFGSPCGCVFPMKVRLLPDVAPYAVFPVMSELEIEIAAGPYLEQSQVKTMGASADSLNRGRTIVDMNLERSADKNKGPLDWDARMKIALGAARGLAYLHEDSNPRVIHRDFKAGNVLLEHDFTPKVSDFGLAREATEGSQHISTRVMGTFGYVAPEYAMTGHLLVKSDVYSYAVVLLELITGRKPVDMSQPQGQENLVTWARPLLTTREGLEQLVDPALAGTYDFDDMAKAAAIASMSVHPEVTHRQFMGEVVQALKLIYNDSDETCGVYCSQKDSSIPDSEFKGELAPSESRWWNNTGGATPRLTYGHTSSFITMEYSSSPLEDVENRPLSDLGFNADALSLPMRHGNRSGPLRTVRSKPAFYRLMGGSMSEHGILLSKRTWNDGN